MLRGVGTRRIPQAVIDKPPSAGSRPGQTDADDVTPHETLVAILTEYPDGTASSGAVVDKHFGAAEAVLSRVFRVEFRRRQTPPALRIIQKSLGRGWNYPITAMVGHGTPDSSPSVQSPRYDSDRVFTVDA